MTTKKIDRTHAFRGTAELGIANIGAGNGVSFALPPGAVLESIGGFVDTVFDGTTNTLTASDGTTTFVNAADVKALGALAESNLPKYFPNGGTLTVTLAQTGTATAGKAFVLPSYTIIDNGRAGIQE